MSHPEMTLPRPVLIVEDDPVMQTRLKAILLSLGYADDDIVLASSLRSVREGVALTKIAFALVDLGLPDGNGISLIEELSLINPNIPILVISAWSTEAAILQSIQAGATGYILKERDDLEVSISIRSVLRGGAPIDPFIARYIMAKVPQEKTPMPAASKATSPAERLTNREYEILGFVATGMSNKEIAETVQLSRYTVETHIRHIYRKLSVSTRTKAVNTARQMGLI